MAKAPSLPYLTARLHAISRREDCRFSWSRHAEKAAADDGLTHGEVLRIIKTGAVAEDQGERWRVQGRDLDGRLVDVVVICREDLVLIRLITVFALQQRRSRRR